MVKNILFICKSCSSASESETGSIPEGTELLNQVLDLSKTCPDQSDLEIRGVGCLWTCDRPCAVAFSATDKSTYLFTNVPTTAANALLEFGKLYLKSQNRDIPWKQFPQELQTIEVAKIPAVLTLEHES